eukprot:242570_1
MNRSSSGRNQPKPPKQPKIKPKTNPNIIKTEPPPKAFSGPNYGQSQTHNIPNMSTMNRSSSGNKSKRKPNKPPPTNPLSSQQPHASYNGNINMSQNNNNINNKHIKSQSQSSQYKPSRPSPSAPPRFKPKEIVLY